jgi:hypothetical protein
MTLNLSDAVGTEPEKTHSSFMSKLRSGLSNPFILLALLGGAYGIASDFLHLQWGQADIVQTLQQVSTQVQNNAQKDDELTNQLVQLQQAEADSEQESKNENTQVLSSIDRMQNDIDILNRSINGDGRPAIFIAPHMQDQ